MFTVARPKVDWRMSRFCASNFAELSYLAHKTEIEIAHGFRDKSILIPKGWQIFARCMFWKPPSVNKAEVCQFLNCLMTHQSGTLANAISWRDKIFLSERLMILNYFHESFAVKKGTNSSRNLHYISSSNNLSEFSRILRKTKER